MQRVEIIGLVGKDAEVKDFNNNQVINFSVAVTEKHNEKEYTTWYDVSKWGNNTSVAQYIKKGTRIFISGKPTVRAYVNNTSGEAVGILGINAFEIELLSSKQEGQAGQQQSAPASKQQPQQSFNEEDHDLPF